MEQISPDVKSKQLTGSSISGQRHPDKSGVTESPLIPGKSQLLGNSKFPDKSSLWDGENLPLDASGVV